MRVADEVVRTRRQEVAQLLARHQYLAVSELCARFAISPATARRDLAALAAERSITRTYGGALVEFNQRFRSFGERREHSAQAKGRIAAAAVTLIAPGTVCYLDGGSSVYALAQLLAAGGLRPLTIVTINLPAAELLAQCDGIELNLLSGQYLRRQSVLLGDKTQAAARLWRYDRAFLGAEAVNARGTWNSMPEVVQVQRAVAKNARSTCFLVDAQKLGATAPEFLLPWTRIDRVACDAGLERFDELGIPVARKQLLLA